MIYYPADYQYDHELAKWLTKHPEPFNTDTFIMYRSKEQCIVPSNNLVDKQLYLGEGEQLRLMKVKIDSPAKRGDRGRRFISLERSIKNKEEERHPILVTNRERNMILIALRYFQKNEEWRKNIEIVNYYLEDPNQVLNDEEINEEIDNLCERL